MISTIQKIPLHGNLHQKLLPRHPDEALTIPPLPPYTHTQWSHAQIPINWQTQQTRLLQNQTGNVRPQIIRHHRIQKNFQKFHPSDITQWSTPQVSEKKHPQNNLHPLHIQLWRKVILQRQWKKPCPHNQVPLRMYSQLGRNPLLRTQSEMELLQRLRRNLLKQLRPPHPQ